MQQQAQLDLAVLEGGSYDVGGNKAIWRTRSDDPKTIELSFRGKRFRVSKEGRGPQGRPRFLVNRTRQPDGKLLQGRDLPELIRTLDRFWSKLIEIPARLDRIELKLDCLLGKRRRESGHGKLCTEPIAVTWEQKRYVPAGSEDAFARVTLALIRHSSELAAGEYRLLQVILYLGRNKGLVHAGKATLAELAHIDPADAKRFKESLRKRAFIRRTGRLVPHRTSKGKIVYIPEDELLTHPWFSEETDLWRRGQPADGQGEGSSGMGEVSSGLGGVNPPGGGSVPPNKTTNKTSHNETSNEKSDCRPPDQSTGPKLLAPSGDRVTRRKSKQEEELLAAITECFGAREGIGNGGLWRNRIRESARAVRDTIEDYKVRTPEQRAAIKNRGAWATDRYERNRRIVTA